VIVIKHEAIMPMPAAIAMCWLVPYRLERAHYAFAALHDVSLAIGSAHVARYTRSALACLVPFVGKGSYSVSQIGKYVAFSATVRARDDPTIHLNPRARTPKPVLRTTRGRGVKVGKHA
jgi:hypothetical protein